MSNPTRQERLGRLARGRSTPRPQPIPARGDSAAPGPPNPVGSREPAAASKHGARPAGKGRRRARVPTLADLVPGEPRITSFGTHWLHRRVLRDVPNLEAVARALRPEALQPREAPEVAILGNLGVEGALFLDLETCGFSGTPLFLAGLLRVEGREAVLIQLLARDYAEEASVVAATAALMAEHPLLVTFNGRSYDVPFLRDRGVRHGIEIPVPGGHLDLLHAARRRWKDVLPDCRLQTLESRLTGRLRSGDVPGSEVPGRYHDFVRDGDPRPLVPVLRHNLQDLVTLMGLLPPLAA